MMDIRDIEKIIDKAHEQNAVFESGKKQTTYDLLTSFEDMCGLILMRSVLNPLALKQIYISVPPEKINLKLKFLFGLVA